MVRAPEHPLAPVSGLVSAARIVLYDQIGQGPHPCHWCGRSVNWLVGQRGNLRDALVADHLDSNELDDSPDNLVASCGSCNGERGTKVLNDEEYITRANGTRLRIGEVRQCRTCGTDFVTDVTLRHYCRRHRHERYRLT